MSLQFKPRAYTCVECNHTGKVLLAFSNVRNVSEYFPTENILDPIENLEDPYVLYEEILERNDFGMITKRVAQKCACSKCGSKNIKAHHVDRDDNVLNFYPPTQGERWLSGFAKQIN